MITRHLDKALLWGQVVAGVWQDCNASICMVKQSLEDCPWRWRRNNLMQWELLNQWVNVLCKTRFLHCWCRAFGCSGLCGVADLRLQHTERGVPPWLAARNLSYSILHHQWQTESSLTRRPAVGCSSHYSFVFEDSLSTRPVQDGHRKTDWPSEKQCFSLWCGPQWLQKRGEEGRSMAGNC